MARWSEHLDPLMECRYAALLAYAAMLTAGDRASAEDIVHDAVIRVFSRGRGFDSIAHAEAYTRRAIMTVFLDRGRTRARLARTFARIAERDETPERTGAVDDADHVRGLLASLSPRERACVVLRYYDDLSLAEIGETLGIAVGSVKRYLADASARMGETTRDDGQPRRVPVVTHPSPTAISTEA